MRTGDSPSVIGICGLIGSGKSLVSRLLRLNGIPVYDCDLEARRIMDNDVAIHSALQQIAGKDVIDTHDGRDQINRNLLAECMFSDKAVLSAVNALIHKHVRDNFSAWVKTYAEERVVGVECAIIVTSGMTPLCDVLWIVDADEEIRVRRIVERNTTTAERARQWMSAQRPEQHALASLRRERSVAVVNIDNNGDKPLLQQTWEALTTIIS